MAIPNIKLKCAKLAMQMTDAEAAEIVKRAEQYGPISGVTPDAASSNFASAIQDIIAELETKRDFFQAQIDAAQTSKESKLSLDTPEGRFAVAQQIADHLIGDNKFASIVEARKFITDLTGQKIEAGTKQAKMADETVELGVVLAARDIVQAARKQGRSDEVIFDRLVNLYNAQPNLSVRDTTSIRNQAYSTPVPMAFVASRLAGITPDMKVGELTAGNGALMMEVSPRNAVVNEINPDRIESLKAQGFNPTTQDATELDLPPKSLDALNMNPPFGALDGKKWPMGNLETGEIDHAIVMKSLEALKDDGNAVFIIGGVNARDVDARRQAYRGKAKREFFLTLYKNYNVVDHFTLDGSMYSRQGAGFPVDVLVIRGRGESQLQLPAANPPAFIESYDQLKEKLNANYGRVEPATSGTDVRSNLNPSGVNTDQGSVSEPTGSETGLPVPASQPGGQTGGVGPVDGNRTGVDAAGPGRNATGAANPANRPSAGNTDAQTGPVDAQGKPSGQDQQQGSRTRTEGKQPAPVGNDTAGERTVDRQGIKEAAESGKLQVKYANFSGNRSVNTLVSTNHLTAIENAFQNLRARVGDIDTFVRNELQYTPEQFKKSFSAEQVEALALAIDNIRAGKGFIIGDQTGIGKGRVVAAMIRYAKLNGKTPVFVTQMPDLYGDMMRDLNDIGMSDVKPLMTNNNASVPLDGEALAWFSEVQAIKTRVDELTDEINNILLTDHADKLKDLDTKAVDKELRNLAKVSTNPEVISLRQEIAELNESKPAKRGKFLDTPNIEAHEKALQDMVNADSIGDYDVIFTTYTQMDPLDSGRPKRDPVTGQKIPGGPAKFGYRSSFLNHFVNDNAMLILDESHNAGAKGDGKFPSRGDIVREMIDKSGSVFYSSATFAKNPEVMDAYNKTDLGKAFGNSDELTETVSNVPIQQVTSSMLVEAGQYLRRERSFDGIEYESATVEVSQEAAEDVSTAMRLVVAFDKAKKSAIRDIQNDLDQEGAAISTLDGGGSAASVDSVNFTSVMHNVVNTFLLALKADAAAQSAVKAIQNGEKPVITVANTMEMFITEYAKEAGIGIGDKLDATFADVLKRYLEKTRYAMIRRPGGDDEKVYLSDEQLGPDGVDAYNAALEFIDGMELDIPLSPIDHIKQKIEEAGFSIGEITGRQTVVTGGTLRQRNKAEMNTAGKKNTIAKFNNGQLDALIINRSGSTGLSMHASETFEDQRRRVMIIAQAELDINNHMQMLGRVNRTGQVTANGKSPNPNAIYGLPRYEQLSANVPIELRPAAVLANKMANLNANTTAGRKSAVEAKNVPDFMNKYGDRVAAEFIMSNPALNEKLGYPLKADEDGEINAQGAIAKVTGRIGLLPLKDQAELYEALTAEYQALIEQLEALGQNELEAKTYPLDAKTLEKTEVLRADDGPASPFTQPVFAEKVSMKKLGKPYPQAKVKEMVAASLNGKTAQQVYRETLTKVNEAFEKEENLLLKQRAETTDAKFVAQLDKQITTLNAARATFRNKLPGIGASYVLKTDAGNIYGVVTSVERQGKAKSMGALSAWKVKFAVVDGARAMTIPMTQLTVGSSDKAPAGSIEIAQADDMMVVNADRTGFDRVSVMEGFDRGQTDSRETRIMITGNILRGYGALRGRLMNYTDDQGNIRQGILLPADRKMEDVAGRFAPSITNPDAMIEFLDKGGVLIDKETSGATLTAKKESGAYVLMTSKTGPGKKLVKTASNFYFVSSGNKMRLRMWDLDDFRSFMNGPVKSMQMTMIPNAATKDLLQSKTQPDTFRTVRTAKSAQIKLSEDAVKQAVASALNRVVGAPTVNVVANPAAVGISAPAGVVPKGVTLPDGSVFVFTDGAESVLDVFQTVFHELFHRGSKVRFTTNQDYITKMLDIASKDEMVQQEVDAWKKSSDGQDKWQEFSGYGPMTGARLANFEALAVEEALAAMAERVAMGEVRQPQSRIKQLAKFLSKVANAWGMSRISIWLNTRSLAEAERFILDTIKMSGGTANQFSNSLMFRSPKEVLESGVNAARNMPLPAGYIANDFMESHGKVGWWHKTVGTMFDLAQRRPEFKRVFDSAQSFLNDVSYYATEAANLAPNILPKLETLKDITKSPLSPEDNKAISAPIFEGTLIWTRDPSTRKPVKMEELEAKADKMRPEDKAQELLKKKLLSPSVLAMWKGLPLDKYEALVNGKYQRELLKPGIVFTDKELKDLYKLTDKQISLYREFRSAVDKSLDNLALADMARYAGKDIPASMREEILEAQDVYKMAEKVRDHLHQMAKLVEGAKAQALVDTGNKILDKAAQIDDLKKRGYAPLSRFGSYAVDVVENGERVYFGLFESQAEANKMARQMKSNYPNGNVTQGTVSQEQYRLFAGVSPETVELFGEMLGLEGDNVAFQQYIKLAKANRSAMKRLIQRKGISGFSEDPGRVLAGFVYSNARQASGNMHMGQLTEAISQIPQGEGELKDIAVKLGEYVKNPVEEAQRLRGILFAQYLGGNISSALLNAMQSVQVTFPWLSQHTSIKNAASLMTKAMADIVAKKKLDDDLMKALHRAEEAGIVSPQEVFHLQAQAAGRAPLEVGDGTTRGNLTAKANNTLSKVMLAWGKLFSVAEQFNRRAAFVAAYRLAQSKGMANPEKFAEQAVNETQFVYTKANRPQWARGALGATLFTFKSYSISYVELMHRMYTEGGPEGKKAALLGIATLFVLAGAGGLPFAEDVDDLIDGFMQRVMNKNFSSKRAKEEFFREVLGEDGANFVMRGVSGLAGSPVAVQGRLGLGNLLPGTGIFQKKDDYGRDVAELIGPAGDFFKRGFEATGKALQGEILGARGAIATISPTAARNAIQGYEMATTGIYTDQRGRKVIDVDTTDAMLKAAGLQPRDVGRVQEASFDVNRMVQLNKIRETEIADKWARGIFSKDPELVKEAREELQEWNRANPDSPIRIQMPQIIKRVRQMNTSKTERIAKTAPKEIRAQVREELEAAR